MREKICDYPTCYGKADDKFTLPSPVPNKPYKFCSEDHKDKGSRFYPLRADGTHGPQSDYSL